MNEFVKIERSLLASFLVNVNRIIQDTYPDNKMYVLNAISQLNEIKEIIHAQDEMKDGKKSKFKQINLF